MNYIFYVVFFYKFDPLCYRLVVDIQYSMPQPKANPYGMNTAMTCAQILMAAFYGDDFHQITRKRHPIL